jgi:uncharacterized protein (TIGR04255 family)
MEVKNFKVPPIKEVVLDIKLETDSLSKESLFEKTSLIQKEFPDRHPIYRLEGKFNLNELDPKISSNQTLRGYRCFSENKDRITHFTVDGFSYNQLSPYPDWSSFLESALGQWNIYNSNVQGKITRLAIRTINEITIPAGPEKIQDYFDINIPSLNSSTLIPEKQSSRSIYKYEEFKIVLNFSITYKSSNESIVILDIDVILNDLDIENTNFEKIKLVFEQRFHFVKNKIFFESLKDKIGEVIL